MAEGVHMVGAKQLVARIEKLQTDTAMRKHRAAKAAANSLKVLMRQLAPVSATRGRDVARKRLKVKHMRATITVRPDYMLGSAAFTVGPRSSVTHLVVRGTGLRHEVVGGTGGDAHHETLRARRAIRQTIRANRGGQAGPRFGEAHALAWDAGGGTLFANSANPGPMHGNDFIAKTRAVGAGEAHIVAGAVLFHDMPDPNEGA